MEKYFFHINKKRACAVVLSLLAAATALSCRSYRDIEKETTIQQRHDTTVVYIHDTTSIMNIQRDSVDRFVERLVYVDSFGVVHERETEHLYKIINSNNAEFSSRENVYIRRIQELEDKISDRQKETTVEISKPLNWLQKSMMAMGVCFILALAGYGVRLYLKLKK